jgi:peptidoglycan L-alanyl-D-glutamate endopeptidase CwlK
VVPDGAVNSRAIDDLHPIVALKARRYLARAEEEGIGFVVVSTLRNSAMQEWLWNHGRTALGPRWTGEWPLGQPLTYNQPGLSWHEYGMAFDAYPVVGCRLVTISDACDMPVWRKLKQISREQAVNLRMWLQLPYAKGSVRQYGHHQYTGGLTIEQVAAGERLPDLDL